MKTNEFSVVALKEEKEGGEEEETHLRVKTCMSVVCLPKCEGPEKLRR